jgi:hypothetical protein
VETLDNLNNNATASSATITPSTLSAQSVFLAALVAQEGAAYTSRTRLTIKPNSNFQFNAGSVAQTTTSLHAHAPPEDPLPNENTTDISHPFTWTNGTLLSSGALQDSGGLNVYQIQSWKVQDQNGDSYSCASTEIEILTETLNDWKATHPGQAPPTLDGALFGGTTVPNFIVTVTVLLSSVSVSGGSGGGQVAPKLPCLTESGNPKGAPLFPATPPWLHTGDPQGLSLATAYAYNAMTQAAAGSAGSSGSSSGQSGAQLAKDLYSTLWSAAYPQASATDPASRTALLQKLLQGWCQSLAYPGPTCQCCSHGVVIGSVRVEGGTIRYMDPWAGRRFVVHYPLLAHWGQQFGIMPLDAMASRLFHIICCVAHLAAPSTLEARDGSFTRFGRESAMATLSGGRVLVESPQNIAKRFSALGVTPQKTVALQPLDFATRVLGAAFGAAGAGTTALVDYVPVGMPNVHLLAPEDVGAPQTPTGPATGWLNALVQTALAPVPAPPPLLRGYAASLARHVLAVTPLVVADDGAQKSAADALSRFGVTNVASLVDHDPDTVLRNALGGTNADALNALLTAAEGLVRAVTPAVADAVSNYAIQASVSSRNAFTDSKHATAFGATLAARLQKLKAAVSPDATTRAVSQAAMEN